MPKKKTGQRKKKEKQKEVQKSIQSGSKTREDVKKDPANQEMTCDRCLRRQKNRFACYFCFAIQKLPQCVQCARTKCLATGGGDCVVKHLGRHAIGMSFNGAICDFCEGVVCHSRKCLQAHACSCLCRNEEQVVICIECDRSVWEQGGRVFKCATCQEWLCEDDQFEHQASCQVLEADSFKCVSCSRLGQFSCLRCKVCFCSEHVKGGLTAALVGKKGVDCVPCKKCGFELQETKNLSMSIRKHEYGRHQRRHDDSSEDEGPRDGFSFQGFGIGTGASVHKAAVSDSDEEDSDDEESD